MEVRQEQLPVPCRHGLSAQRQDRVARRLRQVLPQPDEYVEQRRIRPVHRRSSRRTTATARRPMRWPTPGRTGSRHPPGSSLGAETFLGRGPTTSNPDFVVPNVHQFSAGIQRELPWRISLEATYAGSRSYDIEGNFGGFNEPSAAFQAQCDVTLGGSRSLCDQTLPNPFLGVAGFENTNRFTSTTLSRFELARPFPAFTGFGYNQQNLGTMQYDSMQLVANKRWARGVTINASYTWVPRWTEDGANTTTGIGNAYVDEVSKLKNHGPYFSHRKHRLTASGVYQFPGPEPSAISLDYCSAAGRSPRCWSSRPASRGTCPATSSSRPVSTSRNVALPGEKDGQFIYGAKPCIGQRQANGTYNLAVRLAGVRLHRAVLPHSRGVPAPHDDVPLRRVPPAVVLAGGRELREDHADHRHACGSSCVSRRSTSSTARSTTSGTTTTTLLGGLRPHQPQHHGSVELPALRPAGIPPDVLMRRGRGDRYVSPACLLPVSSSHFPTPPSSVSTLSSRFVQDFRSPGPPSSGRGGHETLFDCGDPSPALAPAVAPVRPARGPWILPAHPLTSARRRQSAGWARVYSAVERR